MRATTAGVVSLGGGEDEPVDSLRETMPVGAMDEFLSYRFLAFMPTAFFLGTESKRLFLCMFCESLQHFVPRFCG